MTGETAVVLGASGFIGARLVRRLAAGGVRVRALDIRPSRELVSGVDYILGDVREPIDPEIGRGASLIYNIAALHRTPGHRDEEYFETNVAGALNATALAEACGVNTILFTSSISVYGPCEETRTEASPLRPVTAYGRSKQLAEQIHRLWLNAGPDRRLIVARPGVIFGPGEVGNYTHLARALRGGYFAFPGRRDTVKSGGYVDELLSSFAFAIARPEREVLYNFAYPHPSTTEEIVSILARVIGRDFRPVTIPLAPMLVAAQLFEWANALGFKSWIHPDRVMKLVQSTRISPAWLLANGYVFSTDLEAALRAWSAETDGRFD